MATMPTFSKGHIILADEWNNHANQINTNTDGISSLDTRVTDLESDVRINPQADDTRLYGDIVSNVSRSSAFFSEVLSVGVMTSGATLAAKSFTATELRICCTEPSEGTTYFDVGFYVGPDTSNLTKQAESTNITSGNALTTGMKTISLPSISITEGDAMAIWFGVQNSTTAPHFSSTWYDTGADILINAGQNFSAFDSSQSLPPPSSMNMNASTWTASTNQFWFALA